MPSGFPNSPRLVRGGIVTMDPDTSTVRSVIALQYNPDTMTRSLQVQAVPGGQDGVRVDALRLRGPAIEQLAQLEMLVNPTVETLIGDDNLANNGTLEIIPLEQALTLFVWSKSRVVPVRMTDFSITEEAFDPNLNPIRAKVSLGMRVLNVDDLGFSHPGGRMFMTYLTNKQQLASKVPAVAISVLGLGGLR
jgi:hypothetical protein